MAIMKIVDLKEGMILKSSVCDKAGCVLIKQGAVITSKHIEFLKKAGISMLEISEVKNNGENVSTNGNSLEIKLQKKFGDSLENEINKKIFEYTLKIRLKKLGE